MDVNEGCTCGEWETMGEEPKGPEPYPFWRWGMWVKNYGSYNEIEEKVASGELDPLKPSSEYPDLSSK